MPDPKTRRRVLFSILISIFFMLSSATFTYVNIVRIQSARVQERDAHRAVEWLDDTNDLIRQVDETQWRYLFLGAEQDYSEFETVVKELREKLDRVNTIPSESSANFETEHFKSLLEDLEEGLAEREVLVELGRVGGVEAVQSTYSDEGRTQEKFLLTTRLQDAISEEMVASRQLSELTNPLSLMVLVPSLFTFLFGIFAIGGFVYLFRQQLSQSSLADQKLANVRARLDTVLGNVGEGIITTDRDGNISYLNAAAELLTGWSRREATGLPHEEVFHVINGDTGERVESLLTQSLHRRVAIRGISESSELITKSGERIAIDESAAPIVSDFGDLLGCSLVFRDMTLQRQQKQALLESERMFRETFDNATIGVAHVSIDGTFLRVNRRFGEIVGYESDEMVGMSFRELTYPEDVERDVVGVKGMLDGDLKSYKVQKRYRTKNGDSIWVDLTSSVLLDDSGEPLYFITIVQDISERRQAEAIRSRLAAIVESSDDAICGKSFDGTVTSWNPAAERLFGFSEKEMIGNPIFKIVPEERVQEEKHMLERVSKGERIAQYETTRMNKDGDLIECVLNISPIRNDRGVAVGVSSIARDITATKLAEETLQESQNRFKTLADNISQFAWMADPKGWIYWYNKRWYDYTGTTFEEMQGWGWKSVHHPDYVDQVVEKIQYSWDTGEPWEDTFPLRGRDGQYRWFLSRAQPIRNANGDIECWFGSNTDITELKEIEASLEQAKIAAENANQSRGEFLANMSHEIRTPMTAILGHADILAEHLENPDNIQCVQTIQRNGQYLLQIINDILDLSKIDAGKLQIETVEIEPENLLADVRSLMDVRAHERKLEFIVEIDGKVPARIKTDPVRLRQILLNLIGNALKFTDVGQVRLVTRYDQKRRRLQFVVTDTGCGISDTDLRKIFRPFTQADTSSTRSFQGTGLGLAISRRLAQALGGDIAVDSEQGVGSEFTLTIPSRVSPDIELVSPSLERALRTEDASVVDEIQCRVLVVDDRREIRFLAQRLIEKAGGTVVAAEHGAQAVDMLANPDLVQDIDLVIMDMQMPVMDGYAATRRLREQGFEKPIIALTANAMKDDRDKCLDAGCNDYATKPLDGQDLIRKIARQLEASTG